MRITIQKSCLAISLASILFFGTVAARDNGTNTEKSNAEAIEKLKSEATANSKIMEIAFNLTDVNGPRLTGSPGFLKAANWAKKELASYGLQNARLESWGEFGKGWEQEKCYVAITAPYYTPIIAIPKAWSGSTAGKKGISGEVVLINATDSLSFVQQYQGKLTGKIVMMVSKEVLKPSFTGGAKRYEDSVLEKMANAPLTPAKTGSRGADFAARVQAYYQLRKMNDLLLKENPALILSSGRGTDGTVFVQGNSGSTYARDSKPALANVAISADDFLRIQRLIQAGIPVKMEADIKTKTIGNDMEGYNVLAEIPGTDPLLKDEIVMLGAHLDSWQGSTGATDNAAGCAVMMEAVRLLQLAGLQPRRTIRIALWGGEEQGTLGSKAWVNTHVADPIQMELKREHEKISTYFNLDNGTGRIRGIYCEGNLAVMPIFENWFKNFGDPLAKTVTISSTASTDHESFDAVGIPAFQFIQDEIEYSTRTHHTNMDSYDHLVPEDLKQAATLMSVFVYNAAQRDEKLPRKELPKAKAAGRF